MPRKLKIAYLSEVFPEISQTFVMNEIRSLRELGANIHVLALRKSIAAPSDLHRIYGFADRIAYVQPQLGLAGKLANFGVAALKLAAGRLPTLLSLASRPAGRLYRQDTLIAMAQAVRALPERPDIVHCHFGTTGILGARLKAAGAFKAKLSTTFHGYDLSVFPRTAAPDVYDELFRVGDRHLAISRHWAEQLVTMGAPAARTRIMHMGVDVAAFEFRPRQPAPGEPFRFVAVGRMAEKKGHLQTIRAFAAARRLAPDRPMLLDIVGGGELLGAARELVAELGLAEVVTLRGALPHERVKALLDGAHAFAMHNVTAASGDKEGIPVVLMEAMAAGLPALSTFHSGIPELIEDGVSGLLARENDIDGFAACMVRISADADLRLRLARAARRKVETEFNQDIQARLLMNEFEAMVG